MSYAEPIFTQTELECVLPPGERKTRHEVMGTTGAEAPVRVLCTACCLFETFLVKILPVIVIILALSASQVHLTVEKRSTVIKFDNLKEDGEGAYLIESGYKVVLQKSIPAQIRQRIPYHY